MRARNYSPALASVPQQRSPTISQKNLTVMSWNLHKGRSPFGFRVWNSMRQWVQSMHADVYFLQEALAKRVSTRKRIPFFTNRQGRWFDEPAGFSAKFAQMLARRPPPFTTTTDINLKSKGSASACTLRADGWYCQATEMATALHSQCVLGPNVFKTSRQHGNAILSPHPLDFCGCWDISAHRFEQRGLLMARIMLGGRSITLLCVHLALTRAARLRQIHWIARWILCEVPYGPLVLAGDFNDWRNDAIPILGEIGMLEVAMALGQRAKTFPAFSPALALDKMFVRALTPIEWLVPEQKTAWLSDHLPYMARLLID